MFTLYGLLSMALLLIVLYLSGVIAGVRAYIGAEAVPPVGFRGKTPGGRLGGRSHPKANAYFY